MLTQERLKEILCYDPETGIFKRLKATSNAGKVGVVVGCDTGKGYLHMQIDGTLYKLHRLAFLYMVGYIPENQVDHINGKRDDQRWCNLREVSQSCNSQNQKINSRNTSGFKGVCFDKQLCKWKAYVKLNGKIISLGVHTDKISAALARITFEDQCCLWNCNGQDVNRKKLIEIGYNLKR